VSIDSFVKLKKNFATEEKISSYQRHISRHSSRSSSRPCSRSSSLLDDEEEESEDNDDSPNGWDSPEEIRLLDHVPTRRSPDLTCHAAVFLLQRRP
jgi:hypothetical protein